MARLKSPVPYGVRRLLAADVRRLEREQKKRTERISKLLREGKIDQARELMTLDRAPILHRVQKFIDAMPEPTIDRSPAATAQRQAKMVELLTSGQRTSINRCWKLAGYGKHRQSLDQLLSSPTVLDLFKRAVDEGKPLPAKYEGRILVAIEERELGIT